MKKVLILLVVCAMVAPVLADGTITLSAVDNGLDVDVVMTVDVAEAGDGPVGIGLDVTVDDNGDLTGVVIADSFFDIYIDLAYDMETTTAGSYTYGAGTPADAVCLVGAPGPTTVAAAMADGRVFAVCVGGLGGATGTPVAPNAQGTSTVLMTISGDPGATATISANAIRGGAVVFKNGGTVTVNDLDILIPTDPGCGCLGDATEDGAINGADVPALMASFNKIKGQDGYSCKFDFTGDEAVNGADIPGFMAVFNTLCP